MSDSVAAPARVARSRFLDGLLPAPDPEPGTPHREFLEAARERRLVVQRCGSCASHQYPGEVLCKRCQSTDVRWIVIPQRGVVYSWVRVWHSGRPEVKARTPYLGVVVDVGLRGVRFVGNLLCDPDTEVEIGAPVVAVFEDLDDEIALVQWEFANDAEATRH